MAPRPDSLSAPGAATYDSNTLTVGDGTWDFTTNTFLLPNLVGVNFEMMRYNGTLACDPRFPSAGNGVCVRLKGIAFWNPLNEESLWEDEIVVLVTCSLAGLPGPI
jgi:hypothetical protein